MCVQAAPPNAPIARVGRLRPLHWQDSAGTRARLRDAGLDAWAADNLAAYLTEQREVTGRLPDDRTVVVERFRDELGDWRERRVIMAQFRNIAGNDLEQFRQAGKQVVLDPPSLKSGDLVPFAQARG